MAVICGRPDCMHNWCGGKCSLKRIAIGKDLTCQHYHQTNQEATVKQEKKRVAIIGAKYYIGQHVLTLKGPGTVTHIDVDDESVFYHVELDNDHGHYIFEGSHVFELIKKELNI